MGLEQRHELTEIVHTSQLAPAGMRSTVSKALYAPTERLLHLDGLRGLAVLLVFFVHLHPLCSGFLEHNSVVYSLSKSLASIGNAGVDLFFLLSGYLIYGIVLSKTSYGVFLRRRIRRIYPTFIVVCVLYLTLGCIFPAESKLYGNAVDKGRYIAANILLLPGIFPIRPIITVAWSLSYEFLFYLIIPLLAQNPVFRTMSSGKRAVLFAGWWVVGSIGLRVVGLQRLQMFVVGIIIYELSKVREFTNRLGATEEYCAAVAFICGLICAYFIFVPTAELVATRSFAKYCAFPLMSACFFLFGTYGLLYSGVLRTFLVWTPVRLLGRVSYSYYLIHGVTLKGVALLLTAVNVPWKGTAMFCTVSISGFALTCLTATLLYLTVEEPLSLRTGSTLLRLWHSLALTYRVGAQASTAIAAGSGTVVQYDRPETRQMSK